MGYLGGGDKDGDSAFSDVEMFGMSQFRGFTHHSNTAGDVIFGTRSQGGYGGHGGGYGNPNGNLNGLALGHGMGGEGTVNPMQLHVIDERVEGIRLDDNPITNDGSRTHGSCGLTQSLSQRMQLSSQLPGVTRRGMGIGISTSLPASRGPSSAHPDVVLDLDLEYPNSMNVSPEIAAMNLDSDSEQVGGRTNVQGSTSSGSASLSSHSHPSVSLSTKIDANLRAQNGDEQEVAMVLTPTIPTHPVASTSSAPNAFHRYQSNLQRLMSQPPSTLESFAGLSQAHSHAHRNSSASESNLHLPHHSHSLPLSISYPTPSGGPGVNSNANEEPTLQEMIPNLGLPPLPHSNGDFLVSSLNQGGDDIPYLDMHYWGSNAVGDMSRYLNFHPNEVEGSTTTRASASALDLASSPMGFGQGSYQHHHHNQTLRRSPKMGFKVPAPRGSLHNAAAIGSLNRPMSTGPMPMLSKSLSDSPSTSSTSVVAAILSPRISSLSTAAPTPTSTIDPKVLTSTPIAIASPIPVPRSQTPTGTHSFSSSVSGTGPKRPTHQHHRVRSAMAGLDLQMLPRQQQGLGSGVGMGSGPWRADNKRKRVSWDGGG